MPVRAAATDWVAPLDGLRAIAALMVLGSHTGALPIPLGTAGVWLFFTLSAFLLMRPFVYPGRDLTLRSIAAFYMRRFFRIFPMYWAYVLVFGILFKNEGYIIDNAVYFHGNDQLWTIAQELLFYLILPLIVVALRPIKTLPVLCAAVLLSGAYLSTRYLTANVLVLPALGSGHTVFYLSPFLCGGAAALVLPKVRQTVQNLPVAVTSLAVAVLVIMPHAYAAYIYGSVAGNLEDKIPLEMSLPFAILLVWLSASSANWLSSILSFWPLRMVGRAGFSVYLIHEAVLTAFNGEFSSWRAFLYAGIVTIGCSIVTFWLIEKPIDAFGRNLAHRMSSARASQEPRVKIA